MTAKIYTIGYGKPPRKTQFKPGQSGNPKGRPKSAQNLSTDLRQELEEKIVVTEGSKSIQITKQRAMVKTLLAKALKGDTRAAQVLVNLKLGLDHAEISKDAEEVLSEEDQAILERFKARSTAHTDKERSP